MLRQPPRHIFHGIVYKVASIVIAWPGFLVDIGFLLKHGRMEISSCRVKYDTIDRKGCALSQVSNLDNTVLYKDGLC